MDDVPVLPEPMWSTRSRGPFSRDLPNTSAARRLSLDELAEGSVRLFRKLQQLDEVVESARVEALLRGGVVGLARHPEQGVVIADQLPCHGQVRRLPPGHVLVEEGLGCRQRRSVGGLSQSASRMR